MLKISASRIYFLIERKRGIGGGGGGGGRRKKESLYGKNK